MSEERRKFAERFAEVADQLGYKGHGKQTALAQYYGLRQPSVKKWFDGESVPDFSICVDICKRARVHYEWLMTGRGPRSIDDYPVDDHRIAHALKVMQAMPEYQLDRAVKIIDTLAEPEPNSDPTRDNHRTG